MKIKKYMFVAIAAVLCLGSCKDEPSYGDTVFMTGTLSTSTVRFAVEDVSSIGLTVSSSAKASADVTVDVAAAPELIESYNQTNNTHYVLPPEGSYTLDADRVTIKTGYAVSTPLRLEANAEKLQSGVAYCLPVKIAKVENGGLKVLESSRTAYVIFDKVIRTKVAQMNGGAWFDVPTFGGGETSPVYALNQMTLEVKVRPSALTSEIAERYINPILGSHESLLLRFGDGSNIPSNKLNFAKVSIGTNYHPDNKPHYETTLEQTFENDNWYHIAVVYDGSKVRFYLNGELEVEKNTTGGQINLAMSYGGHGWDDTFAIGRSYGSHWTYKGCVSECRVWNVARSQAEIASSVCYVDPTTDGLVAYWRFNGELQQDGSVLDETGHGHNAVPHGTITWPDNQRCPF